jgi:tetratricopeptide (TPR) repeat protein
MAESTRIDELKRRVLLDPASIAFAALAEEYRRAGQYEESIATCRAGLQRHPAYLSARVTLGRSLLELGRYDEARDELENVLRVAPENLAAIRGLAEIHQRRGGLPEPDPVHTHPPIQSPSPGIVAAEAPPAPAAVREPEPIRPVRVSTVPVSEAAEPSVPLLEAPAPFTLPDLPEPPASAEQGALPALESFLASILRAQGSMRGERSSDR